MKQVDYEVVIEREARKMVEAIETAVQKADAPSPTLTFVNKAGAAVTNTATAKAQVAETEKAARSQNLRTAIKAALNGCQSLPNASTHPNPTAEQIQKAGGGVGGFLRARRQLEGRG